MQSTTRKRQLKRDSKGRFRPRVGWTVIEDRRVQPFFNLGNDQKEAEWRLATIQRLYEENCRVCGEDTWSPRALSYARAIANGSKQISYPPLTLDEGYDDPTLEYAQMIETERKMFPSANLVPSDPALYAKSRDQNQDLIAARLSALEAQFKELGALPENDSLPANLVSGYFHEALDRYAEHIKTTGDKLADGTLKPYQRLRLKRVERFKREHPDFPLYAMNLAKCEELVAFWRNRPMTLWKRESSDDNSRHHIGELFRFWDFLDAEGHWKQPNNLKRLNRKVTQRERRLSTITKEIYSPDQLGVINRHATPLERLVLYVGLNCGMGAAELGRLQIDDVLLSHQHEYAARLNFSSSPQDSFIRFLRPKTCVFGEWLLWPETVQMLQWAIERSKSLSNALLFVWDNGEPMYKEGSTNPQAGFRKLWVEQLLRRVRKSFADFPLLPPGTLRDTLPDMLRHHYDSELASMAIAHGSPYKGDNLLDCYGNKPWGRFHKAMRQVRELYAPVFGGVTEPTREEKHYLPIVIKDRIAALKDEGMKPGKIAEECSVSRSTVWRVLKPN